MLGGGSDSSMARYNAPEQCYSGEVTVVGGGCFFYNIFMCMNICKGHMNSLSNLKRVRY